MAIKSFRHKGLEGFFVTMRLPGLDLYELQGARRGTWAIKVSGNWRMTFGFAGKDAERVGYEDYH